MFSKIATALAPKGVVGIRAQSWGSFGLKLTPWGVPLGLVAGWMVYPALPPEFKQFLGLPWGEAAPLEE